MIDEAAGFFHRGIEAQIFVRELFVFVSVARRYTHDDFVGMNLFNRAFFARSINIDPIAGF